MRNLRVRSWCKVIACISLLAFARDSSAQALFVSPVAKGTIKGAEVKYVDGSTIKISSGYGENNGKYWEIPAEFSASVTVTGSQYYYLYINDSSATYPTIDASDLTYSTTAPSWSDSKQGWYNSSNRCLGVFYVDSGSVVYFDQAGTQYIWKGYYIIGSNHTPDTTWQTPNITESSTYLPVNAKRALIRIQGSTAGITTYEAASSSPTPAEWEGQIYMYNYPNRLNTLFWLVLGASRNIRISGASAGLAQTVWVGGFEIER